MSSSATIHSTPQSNNQVIPKQIIEQKQQWIEATPIKSLAISSRTDECNRSLFLPCDGIDLANISFDLSALDLDESSVEKSASKRLSFGERSITRERTPSASPRVATPQKIEPKEVPKEAPELSRAQSIRAVLREKKFRHRELILQKASLVGNIKEASGDALGISSGILIAPDVLLVSRHGFPKEEKSCWVEFTDYTAEPEKTVGYQGQLASADVYEKFGMAVDESADFVLVKLDNKKPEDFPSASMTLKKPNNEKPSVLIHMGFQDGKFLHVSIAETRVVDVRQAIKEDVSLLENHWVTWSRRQTIGVIRHAERREDNNVWLEVESKGGKNTLVITEEGALKIYKNGKISEIETPTLEKPMFFGVDHAIVGHKTDGGSSGGVYFSPEDPNVVFAIHRGVLSNKLFADAEYKHFRNHLIVLPWAEQITDFLDGGLIEEGKKTTKASGGKENVSEWLTVGTSGKGSKGDKDFPGVINAFEDFVASNQLKLNSFTKNATNSPVVEGLDIRGHGMPGGIVKLYLDDTYRAQYSYNKYSCKLNYDGSFKGH